MPEVQSGESPKAETAPGQLLKISIGCGRVAKQPGWTQCDLNPGENVDYAFDATKRWPFPDNCASEVHSSHVLEHLADPLAFFEEAYRVLVPNGQMNLRLPYGGHHAAWWDISHLRPWFAETFAVLQPGYDRAIGNPQHQNNRFAFGVNVVQMRVSLRLAGMLRHWWWRWAFARYHFFFDSEIEEIWGSFFALKTDEAQQEYMKDHQANVVGSEFVAWKHHLQKKAPPKDGEPCYLVSLGSGIAMNGFINRVINEEK